MSKTCYHSELVKEGEVEITLTCDKPQASKFQGQPDFISFKMNGEERYYPCENDECADALSHHKGDTVTILATGRADDAQIEIVDDGGSRGREREREREPERGRSRQPERRQERQPERGRSQERQPERGRKQEQSHQRTAEEREEDEAKAFKKAKYHAARCAVLMGVAFKAAGVVLLEEFGPKAMDDREVSVEDIRAVAMTIFIELSRSTDITKLPVKMPEPEAPSGGHAERRKEPERQREEPRRQEPEREEGETEDDVPFNFEAHRPR